MKCVYCNEDFELTVSDIIPYAMTGAKVKKRFVCKKHNAFTNDNYEKIMIDSWAFYRNFLGLKQRNGDDVKYTADVEIGDVTVANASLSDKSSFIDGSRLFNGVNKDGEKVKIGANEKIVQAFGNSDKIKQFDAKDITIVHRGDLRDLFTSNEVLHTVAKVGYEWHCYINDIEERDDRCEDIRIF